MKLFDNNFISTALVATAASVAISAPAQALSLTGIDTLGFDGFFLEITDTGLDFYRDVNTDDDSLGTSADFNYALSGGVYQADWLEATGSIKDTDFGAGLGLEDFLTVTLSTGQMLSMDLDSAILTADDDVLLSGLVSLTLDDGTDKLFSGKLEAVAVQGGRATGWTLDVTAVPTPAAVLPILTGLFGVASKRNKSEEA